MGDLVHEVTDRPIAAQDAARLVAPRLALLGIGAGFVFGFAGVQGGLLGQIERLTGGGFAAVIVVELLGQLADTVFDRCASRRPLRHQFGGHTVDLADRPFPGIGL